MVLIPVHAGTDVIRRFEIYDTCWTFPAQTLARPGTAAVGGYLWRLGKMESANRQDAEEDEDFFPTNLPMSAEYEELVLEPIPHYDNRSYVPAMWLGPLSCVSSEMPEWLLPLLMWPYIQLAKQGKDLAFAHAKMAFHTLLHWERAFGTELHGRWRAKYERDLEHRLLYRW